MKQRCAWLVEHLTLSGWLPTGQVLRTREVARAMARLERAKRRICTRVVKYVPANA